MLTFSQGLIAISLKLANRLLLFVDGCTYPVIKKNISQQLNQMGLKFIYSEKATKFWHNFQTLLTKYKKSFEISSNFCSLVKMSSFIISWSQKYWKPFLFSHLSSGRLLFLNIKIWNYGNRLFLIGIFSNQNYVLFSEAEKIRR